ncbi:MAG: hypothetical protein ABF651_06790 [Sporolactobacillus sp.]
MKIIGFDVTEWAALITALGGLVGAAYALFRFGVLKPMVSFITELVENHIEPLKKALDDLTISLNLDMKEHQAMNKRLTEVENEVRDHRGRITKLEEEDKK